VSLYQLRHVFRRATIEAATIVDLFVDGTADVIRQRVDDFAIDWLMRRRGLPHDATCALLEHLGAQVGAKITMDLPP
jgi:hypothetical protein